jgi:N-formylmaleamate deformylase
MVQWKTGTADARGTKLHYYRGGDSRKSIVLVHGITDDGLCWLPVVEVLSDEYDVIMVDLRGHGKSEAPEEGYDRETMALELSALIDNLHLERPILIGHSLGGLVAMTLASLSPNLPRAMILEDPAPSWRRRPPTPEEVITRAEMRLWMEELKRKTRDELLEMARSENPSWPEAELVPWVDSKQRFSQKIVHIIDTLGFGPMESPSLVDRIVCPVLLITADPKRGAILTDDDVAELQKSVPHMKRVHIPDAGHNIRREQFSLYMEAVQTFLTQMYE